MITFSITKENAKILDTFVKKSKDICTNSKYVLSIVDDKLFVAFESSFFAAKLYLELTDVTKDPSLEYFTCDLVQLSQTIQKLIKNSYLVTTQKIIDVLVKTLSTALPVTS